MINKLYNFDNSFHMKMFCLNGIVLEVSEDPFGLNNSKSIHTRKLLFCRSILPILLSKKVFSSSGTNLNNPAF